MWQNYDIVLLPKPNKVDFRPIPLSSCVLKLFEKLIKSRLERFIELDLLLPVSQYGFRKGKSCGDYVVLLLLEIYRGFITHNPVGALFLDIKGAYDNVISCILFDTINNLKIPSHYKNFIRNLIAYRQVNFYEKGFYHGSRILYRGLPQGSSLSPILFNLYIKDILKHIPYDCKTIQFADDIVITCSYKDINKIINSLQTGFNRIQEWLCSLGLELSLAKTQFVLFSRSRSVCTPVTLKVNSDTISSVSRVKYLGIILDAELRWSEHIKLLRSRALKYINILKWLVGRGWGLTPSQVINFINATIIHQLLWGSVWFVNASKSNFKILETIAISAYKLAMGLPKSASNKTSWAISSQP